MKVWDLSTRLYHWIQVVLFIALIITGQSGEGPHVLLGLTLITLLLWRIVWGIIGSHTSRFSTFVTSPKKVIGYLKGKNNYHTGHNPAGGYMVVLLLFTLLLQTISGLAISGMLDSLPYSSVWLNDDIFDLSVIVHTFVSDLLLFLVGIHILAVLIYEWKGNRLTKAMITGSSHPGKTAQPLYWGSTLKSGAVFIIITILIYILYANY